MKAFDGDAEFISYLENAVAFTLFGNQRQPTLTVSEQIASRVAERIIQGVIEQGSAIREQDLADEFAVSRGPIREAIRILEREGLATINPRRGAIVTDLTTEEVHEIFEIRAGLFEIVHRKIAEKRDPDLLAIIRAGVSRLENLAELDDDDGQYAETSYRLSIVSVRECGNKHLARMLTALSLQTLRYSRISLKSKQRRQQSAAIWREATDALERGDTKHYLKLVRKRIDESGAEAVRQLKKFD